MLVLIVVGEDTQRETTPTSGLSVSSKFNFLGLYAKQYQEVELVLWGVSPLSAMVPLAEEETSWLMPTLGQDTAAWQRGNVLAGSGFPMKLKTDREKNCIRTQGTDTHWRLSSPGGASRQDSFPSSLTGKVKEKQRCSRDSCCAGFHATTFFVLEDISSGCKGHDANPTDPGE